ncbi:MAG: STAS domain-containing protein [Pseudomonadota bacterium]
MTGGDEAFDLAGDLDANSVAEIHRRTSPSCRAGKLPATVDLSQVRQTDSSALALLLSWQEAAEQAGRSIAFTAPPESLRVLAELSQVSPLLGWRPADDDDKGENA